MQPYAVYEEFIAGLARTLLQPPSSLDVSSGLRNHIRGASGVRHQIDVSFEDATEPVPQLVLVECKHLNEPVKLAHVKVLKATIDDIAGAVGGHHTVVGILVSRKGAQRGAAEYARHYSVEIQQIESQREYDFAYRRWRVSGRAGAAHGGGHATAEGYGLRTCTTCGTAFRVRVVEQVCANCNRPG